jgi:hypothetical protein
MHFEKTSLKSARTSKAGPSDINGSLLATLPLLEDRCNLWSSPG